MSHRQQFIFPLTQHLNAQLQHVQHLKTKTHNTPNNYLCFDPDYMWAETNYWGLHWEPKLLSRHDFSTDLFLFHSWTRLNVFPWWALHQWTVIHTVLTGWIVPTLAVLPSQEWLFLLLVQQLTLHKTTLSRSLRLGSDSRWMQRSITSLVMLRWEGSSAFTSGLPISSTSSHSVGGTSAMEHMYS